MNSLYPQAKDVVLIRRTSDNKEFEEYPLAISPVSALVTDPTNNILCVSLCSLHVGFAKSSSYAETASYALTSSYAFQALSASWALSSSYAYSSSYAITASYSISASTALIAYSAAYASYAETASYGLNFFAPSVTSSYISASNTIWADTFVGYNALIGRAINSHISQSVGFGNAIAITQSYGVIPQDGMYRLTVAGTVAFYSGSNVTTPPSWSFKHSDRLGSYVVPTTQPALGVMTPSGPSYTRGYYFSGEYIFQATHGTSLEWYLSSNGVDPSSAHGSASFVTTTTLAQITSGSVQNVDV